MKIGLIYTSTTLELIELVEKEVRFQLGEDITLLSYEDPSILADTRAAGYVTPSAAIKLISLYLKAANDGAVAILNLCSSVGEVADCVQDMAKYIGIPIVRVDEEMCRDAVRRGSVIAVLATLPTTLEPTKNTLKRVARELGRPITLIDGLVDAFGADQDKFKSLLLEKSAEVKEQADVILLCQGSMAYAETTISSAHNIVTLSSPRYGAAALKSALISLGLLS